MALTTARKFLVRGRPRGLWAGRIGAIRAHASSVKSVSNRSSFSNTDQLQLPNPTFQTPSKSGNQVANLTSSKIGGLFVFLRGGNLVNLNVGARRSEAPTLCQ